MHAAPSLPPTAPPTSGGCAPWRAPWRRVTTKRASASASRCLRQGQESNSPMGTAIAKSPLRPPLKKGGGGNLSSVASQSLLVEILTEELPPRALARLMETFSHGLFEGLKDKNFLPPAAEFTPYATPRRLAVLISSVLAKQADRVVERKGPALASALDASGQPAPALLGFAKSCGVDVTKLERQAGEKGEYFVSRPKKKGEPLKNHLAAIVEAALKKLPVPKTMRWGAGEAQFVRPVHGAILLPGNKVVAGTAGGRGRWDLGKSAELVDEVTSIVEYPVVLAGSFDKMFLAVPKECLIISMQQHEKYFPLADARGELLPNFLFVSNMQAANPKDIIRGNESVPRGSPRPICLPTWSASFRNCRASWVVTMRAMTAKPRWWPRPSNSITSPRPLAVRCRKRRWRSAWRLPTNSTRSPASSVSGSRRAATRTRSACGARRSALCACSPGSHWRPISS